MNPILPTIMLAICPIQAVPRPDRAPNTLRFDFTSSWPGASAIGVYGGSPAVISDSLQFREVGGSVANATQVPAGWNIEVNSDGPREGLIARFSLTKLFSELKHGHPGGGQIILSLGALEGTRALRAKLDGNVICKSELTAAIPNATERDRTQKPSAKSPALLSVSVPHQRRGSKPIEDLFVEFIGTGPLKMVVEAIEIELPDDRPLDPSATGNQRAKKATGAFRKGMWAWRHEQIIPSRTERAALVAFCQAQDISDLFLKTPYAFDGEKATVLLRTELVELIADLTRKGVRVHALEGHPEYVLPKNHKRVLAFVDGIRQFNDSVPASSRFSGVHLDNEPYILDTWQDKTQRDRIHQQYFDLNAQAAQRCAEAMLEFGLDVPFWFDSVDERGDFVYWIERNGQRVPFIEAIVQTADLITIMSYRERILGSNSVLSVCATEFDLGQKLGTDVLASVELGRGSDVEPGTSLGRYDHTYIQSQLRTLRCVAPKQPGCTGIAVHYYDVYRKMEFVR